MRKSRKFALAVSACMIMLVFAIAGTLGVLKVSALGSLSDDVTVIMVDPPTTGLTTIIVFTADGQPPATLPVEVEADVLPITTQGSVGLDETLSMVAEVPLRAQLFGPDLSFGSLEGETLRIRIGGTLAKPKLDRGALAQLTSQLLQNATRGVLFDEVNKQLERLFPLQPQPSPSREEQPR